jgi:outer membrane immunogenic protein
MGDDAMRKLISAAVGISALLMITPWTAVKAADLPVKAPPPPMLPPCIWCGWYAGINIGGSWGDDPFSYVQPANNGLASTTLHPNGGIGGAQIGYNWLFGGFLFGLEGDLNARHNSATVNGLQPFPLAPLAQVNVTETDNWLSTGRVRAGWATGNLLFYGTGGVAVGEVSHSYTQLFVNNPAQSLTLSDSVVRTGWTAGVGLEWMALHNVSFGFEYLHVDLGRSSIVQSNSIVSGGVNFTPTTAAFNNRSDIVRAKVNFYFNEPPAPVVARY